MGSRGPAPLEPVWCVRNLLCLGEAAIAQGAHDQGCSGLSANSGEAPPRVREGPHKSALTEPALHSRAAPHFSLSPRDTH